MFWRDKKECLSMKTSLLVMATNVSMLPCPMADSMGQIHNWIQDDTRSTRTLDGGRGATTTPCVEERCQQHAAVNARCHWT